jgi:hypothetical protein
MAGEDDSGVRDRLSARFDDEESSDEQDSQTELDENESVGNAGTSNTSMNEGNAWASKNVKKDWNATTIYLPDDLNGAMTTAYKRTDLELSAEFDHPIKKTRHYYPLVIALGMEQLESMEANEVMEALEEMSSGE